MLTQAKIKFNPSLSLFQTQIEPFHLLSMAVSCGTVVAAAVVVALVVLAWSVLNWVWVRPRRLEKLLREQGLKGNSYRLLFGDMKELAAMAKEAKSKPISLSDDIVPRVLPLFHKLVTAYGTLDFYTLLFYILLLVIIQ